jgi:arginine exporter protein ArgO
MGLRVTWFLVGAASASVIWWVILGGLHAQMMDMLRGFI